MPPLRLDTARSDRGSIYAECPGQRATNAARVARLTADHVFGQPALPGGLPAGARLDGSGGAVDATAATSRSDLLASHGHIGLRAAAAAPVRLSAEAAKVSTLDRAAVHPTVRG